MGGLRIWLVTLLVAAPVVGLGPVTVVPMEEPAPGVDVRLGERIEALGEQLATLDRALLDAELRRRSASEGFPLAPVRERLRSLQRLHAQLDSWHRASLEGREIRSEAQQLMLLFQLRSVQWELQRELTQRSAPTPLSNREQAVSLRNGTGTFSGTVTAEGTGSPLEGVQIDVFDSAGVWIAGATTDAAGDYTTPPLSAGVYFAYTVDMNGYVNELYDDIFCSWICDVTGGTPIVVAATGDTPGIDFQLALGGRISGTVRDDDTSAALDDVFVDIYDDSGQWVTNPVTFGSTGVSGQFRSPGLPPGSYHATTYNEQQYVDERYADQACPFGCDATAGTSIPVTVGGTTSGIDFDLTPGGWITGTVTEQTGGAPIEGVWVRIHDSAGQWVTDGETDGSGDFASLRGLPAGTYYARTDNAAGYLDELYSEKSCAGSCDVTTGDAIPVALGAAASGVDFTLENGGSIAGSVIEEGTGLPIVGLSVEIFDASGTFVASSLTDGGGLWQIETGLAPGTYYGKTASPLPWVDELWDDQLCPAFCTITGGTPITVSGTATTSGIDFVLGRGGEIAGTVRAVGGAPLEGVWIDVFDPEGNFVANGPSDATGAWKTWGTLPPGSYFLRTWNQLGSVDELFDDLPCPGGCDVTTGRAVPVFSTATTVGVDFELAPGTVLTGTVREKGTAVPIEGVAVNVWDDDGLPSGGDVTDSAGEYASAALPAGRYRVGTWNELGYVDQLHEGIPCLGCVAIGGEPVTVPGAGAVDFDLAREGRITGTVTQDLGGAPIVDAHVELWSPTGRLLQWTATDGSGDYALERLPGGSFYVKTWNEDGWVDEIWSDQSCASCDATTGTPVEVVEGETTANVDFALVPGGGIAGTVTIDEQAAVDLVRVRVYDSEGWFVANTRPDGAGDYLITGLPTGSYSVSTNNGLGYANEAWDDSPCVGTCEPVSGTPVAVTAGTTTMGIDFDLELGGRIAGTVTAAATGAPIDAAEVWIYDSTGVFRLRTRVGADGHYRSWGSVAPGTYYAATSNFAGFYDEVFEGGACIGGGDFCDVTAGTPIDVAAGSVVEGIDFTLTSGGGWIEGSVFDALWAHPLSDVDVEISDAVGDPVTRVLWPSPSDGTGRFKSCGLPPGTYYARTNSAALRVPYGDEIWNDVACSGACDPTAGTPIVVTADTATPGVDFRLLEPEPMDTLIFSDGFEDGTTDAWSAVVGEVP